MSGVLTLTEKMSRTEALDMLQHGAFVGRVAFVHHGLPHIVPVNYIASRTSLEFASAPGTKLSALSTGAPVCFEVDGVDALEHSGWSVVVDGIAAEVTEPEEIRWLNRGPLKSWALRGTPRWVRVTYGRVTGIRVGNA